MRSVLMMLSIVLAATLAWADSDSHGAATREPTAGHAATKKTDPHTAPAHSSAKHANPHGEGEHVQVPGPVLPGKTDWTGTVVIVIGALFVAAWVIGPIYRARLPEPPPPAAHDDHGHGDGHGDGHH